MLGSRGVAVIPRVVAVGSSVISSRPGYFEGGVAEGRSYTPSGSSGWQCKSREG